MQSAQNRAWHLARAAGAWLLSNADMATAALIHFLYQRSGHYLHFTLSCSLALPFPSLDFFFFFFKIKEEKKEKESLWKFCFCFSVKVKAVWVTGRPAAAWHFGLVESLMVQGSVDLIGSLVERLFCQSALCLLSVRTLGCK